MLVFGYAATYEIHHVPTVVLDLDHSQESRELVSRFTSSPYFDVQHQLTDARQLGDAIDRGTATVGLEIDAGFAQKLRKGEAAPLQVIVDATNSNTALIASGYISQIALGFAQEYQRDRIYRIAPQLTEVMPSVALASRPWYNPDMRSRCAATPASYTGQFLARYYKSSNGRLEPVEPDAPLTMGEDAPSLDGHPEQAMRVEEPVSLRSKTKRTAAKKTAKRKYTRRKKTVLP